VTVAVSASEAPSTTEVAVGEVMTDAGGETHPVGSVTDPESLAL
jgi:hypothetical protein